MSAPLKFDGASGSRPTTEARRYVYNVLAFAIENDLHDSGGYLLDGIETEPDRRRVFKAARAVAKELSKKAARSVPGERGTR